MGQLAVPLQVASTIIGIGGSMQAAGQARAVGQVEEKQYQRQGRLAFAGAQRKAARDQHTQDLIASRAVAMMAAGGGVNDPGNINLMADITGEGAYRKSLDLYMGKQKMLDYYTQGKLAKMGAQQTAGQYEMKALGYGTKLATILST